MAYTKTTWENLPSTNTPVNATNLNKIENGIKENDEKLLGNKPMGDVIVDSIRTKNMFDKSTIVAGDITGSNTGNRLSSRQVLWLEAGTYTFSCNIASPYRYGILVQNTGIPPLSSATTFIYDAGWKTASNPTTTFTINTAGWVTISFSKEDSSALTPSNVIGYNYQLEKGNTATSYRNYQNLSGVDDIYTTEERLIGNWLGKPLYRKAINFGALPNNTSKSVNTNISDIDTIVNGRAFAVGSTGGNGISIPYVTTSSNIVSIVYAKSSITITSNYNISDRNATIILEYTKTTD